MPSLRRIDMTGFCLVLAFGALWSATRRLGYVVVGEHVVAGGVAATVGLHHWYFLALATHHAHGLQQQWL
eukprot:CAMPEP_0119285214 /NCGR_PEP_ID=MMETSP1329-20130426/31755_1 /TAXON_ID=114041 /ORGANISM="Genus nov. species nov., Strain RCC1024" /LENGTH=69 /DNA_ID=CAMNT_0007285921 /DNA_START=187 /DNA_END=393 /DNA_ORIENTATION=+